MSIRLPRTVIFSLDDLLGTLAKVAVRRCGLPEGDYHFEISHLNNNLESLTVTISRLDADEN